MNTRPIVPAALVFDAEGLPRSPLYGDLYHPRAGALLQARHVFLAGHGLPGRWRGRERFVVLETGFGLGHNFLATWQAWREDERRCERLIFLSVEQHPLTQSDLAGLPRDPALRAVANELAAAWPPLTPNLHRLTFDGARVQLLLAFGDVSDWLREWVASVDAFDLDGFAPARNPAMWEPRLFKAMARMAAPGATLATWSAARGVRDGLAAAGFEVELAAGRGGKRDITLARHAPAFAVRRSPRTRVASERRALIVGAGLAGCAAAWALAEQGWSSTVFDRHARPAQEASGNPAGLFHGTVNAPDGVHARFNRAAAPQAAGAARVAIGEHGARGAVQGLLRLETGRCLSDMQAMLESLGLPTEYVEAVDATRASVLSGIELADPAWHYPAGGWIHPGALAGSFLARAGPLAEFRGGVQVHALRHDGALWTLLDADGAAIDEARTLVLANAGDALRLLGPGAWPIDAVRGQLSLSRLDGNAMPALPRIPIAGSGYLLPEVDGHAVFGATSQTGDGDANVRERDHAANLDQLARLTGSAWPVDPSSLQGRTAWRWVARDRLPLIGAVPDQAAAVGAGMRLDQARFVPRREGLFVFTALGSRGITWAALGGQVLASIVTGAPSPVEASLLDAIDPARFITREARRAASRQAGPPVAQGAG